MFGSLFVKNEDQGLLELSQMLTQDNTNPTFKKEILENQKLDYSIESSKVIMSFLDQIKDDKEFDENSQRVILRSGAYIGEIIKRNSKKEYHWYDYDNGCKLNKSLKDIGKMLGTAAVLYDKKTNEVVFPLGKVMKYIQNGSEDNLEFYIKAIIEN